MRCLITEANKSDNLSKAAKYLRLGFMIVFRKFWLESSVDNNYSARGD